MANKAAKALQAMEKTIKEELEKFRAIQKDLQKCVSSKSKLDGQVIENQNVKEELAILEGDGVVYKLVGPVLVKQDLEEAKQTVDKRLEYITKEVERYEGKIKDLEKQQDTLAEKLAKFQQEYQQQVGKVAALR